MNAQEAIALCRFVKAACPQQAIDEYTPDSWMVLLEPYRIEDCKQAAVDIVRESPFCAPSEIIGRVKQIRNKRLADYGPVDPPPEVERGDTTWRDWWIKTRTAICDGELQPPEPRAVDKQQRERVDRAIEGTFRNPDSPKQPSREYATEAPDESEEASDE